ncbi:hypothetical protein WICPIJ_001952 [Wickerhamomyces pijperi]|uniref:C2H2-type domain-containing protein n=1 Tax=Wickerhamomyces pijperi TaxID=599730 RepID=A0A9P8TQB4_WICPI|nr:hypothetical protein WICPIJ_001952 [Wickerhamomyces pijperi]
MLNNITPHTYTTQGQTQGYTHQVITQLENHKPHQCPQCEYRFKNPSALTRHLSSHSHERRFKCDWDGCHKDYKTSTNLHRHIRLQHRGFCNRWVLTTVVSKASATEEPLCDPIPPMVSRYVDKLVQTDPLSLTILPLPMLHTQISTQIITDPMSHEDLFEDIPPEDVWIESWTATKHNQKEEHIEST